jgi:hypothetical protein
MKAEHRKELHTNLLADRMGRLIRNMKSGPRSTSITTVTIVVVVLLTVVGWYIADLFKERQTSPWVQLEMSGNYDEIARDYPGTEAARSARFLKARHLLREGLTNLYTTSRRGQAIDDLERARELYKELIGECKKMAVLEEEAILGLAMAEESLVNIPKRDEEGSRGSLDEALKWYEKLAKDFPDSFQGQRAKMRIEDIKNNRNQIEGLLADLNRLSSPIR